jgi:hypothetical protein
MHLDATGRAITKGAYVAYVVTNGSTSGIKFGAVVKLKEKEDTENHYDRTTNTYNSVKVTKYSISIVSVENHRGYDQATQTYTKKWEVQGKSNDDKPARVTSIERLDRVIVIDAHQVHPEAKEVIDKEMYERGAM